MTYKLSCPGGERGEPLRPEYIPCPVCGEEVEIWSDEPQGECERCGALVKA
jgi:uncharacterized Zn finger protein